MGIARQEMAFAATSRQSVPARLQKLEVVHCIIKVVVHLNVEIFCLLRTAMSTPEALRQETHLFSRTLTPYPSLQFPQRSPAQGQWHSFMATTYIHNFDTNMHADQGKAL